MEHDAATQLDYGEDSPDERESKGNRHWEWFSQVETLREIAPSEELISLITAVQEFKRSGASEVPRSLCATLLRASQDAWLDVLQNPSEANLNQWQRSIWRDAEVSPISSTMKDGCIHGICISDQQALEYWSRYLAQPTIQEVQIVIPTPDQALEWYSRVVSGEHEPASLREMEQLASLPLSPLIASITSDVTDTSVRDAASVFASTRRFLETLEKNSLWRNSSHQQKILVIFSSPSEEVVSFFKSVGASGSRDGDLYLSAAKHVRGHEEDRIEFQATIASKMQA